ncbi:MAG: PaaI family thioesterase [Deltaproteobacteria bacterium]|nr:PaaI family thioesterase [Candidatus Anaeroferrophillus wilburensis]MBN2888572.1 PaaI family thioesterase [Deltaproteobacteria bacterium]
MINDDLRHTAAAAVGQEPFARLFNIQLVDCSPGYALVEMTPTCETTNLFKMVHGGAIFALIDEAFQVSCNTHGTLAVALNVNVTYLRAPAVDVPLRAASREVSRNPRIATYHIEVTDNHGHLIASAQATAYRKKENNLFHAS